MKEESKKCWEKQMSGEEKNCGVNGKWYSTVLSSVVDPDPYWIRIQELSGSGSTHVNIG